MPAFLYECIWNAVCMHICSVCVCLCVCVCVCMHMCVCACMCACTYGQLKLSVTDASIQSFYLQEIPHQLEVHTGTLYYNQCINCIHTIQYFKMYVVSEVLYSC